MSYASDNRYGRSGVNKNWYKQYTGGGYSTPSGTAGKTYDFSPAHPSNRNYTNKGGYKSPAHPSNRNYTSAGKSQSRVAKAGLPKGGDPKNTPEEQPQIIGGAANSEKDWRVRLSLPPAATGFYRDGGLMAPLQQTDGLIWPVTPTIILQHSAAYTPQEPVHNNYPYYAYNNSRVDAMSIIGNFPVQNSKDGEYWLAALHFLRSVSKMFYGPGEAQGNPPQILRLNGYGQHIFKDVPVIVEQVTVELRESVDYVAVSGSSGAINEAKAKDEGRGGKGNYAAPSSGGPIEMTRVPTDSVFTVLVQPVYSRKNIKDNFTLKDFASGALANKGFI